MNQEKVFKASRAKSLLLVIGSGLFVWAGIAMASSRPFLGWGTVLFFGACGLLGVMVLLKGGGSLQLDDDGFEIVGAFKSSCYRWSDIESIRLAKIRGASVIALNYRKGDARRSQVSRSLTGMDATVGNIYNVSTNDLCETMKKWHKLHA